MKIVYKLQITGIVSESANKLVSKGLLRSYNKEKSLSLFCTYSEYDVPIDTSFDSLRTEDSTILLETAATLIDITQEWALPFNSIPKGHKTICRFEFSKDDIVLLKKMLPVIDSWEKSSYRYYLLKYK